MSHLSRHHGDTLFDFPTKVRLQSHVSNLHRRSATFRLPEKSINFNIWNVRPLDLNPQAFEPKPPKRNTRDAIRPWTYTASHDHQENAKIVMLDQRKIKSMKRKDEAIRALQALRDGNTSSGAHGKLASEKEEWKLRRFRSMDPHEARLKFVKEGMYKPAPYQMPKPFDHRQYEPRGNLELPDFVTKHKDAGVVDIDREINTIYGPQVSVQRETEANTKKDYEDIHHLHYDPQLILPRLPFPNKNAAYSRHRRTDRTARSAYLDRAEEMMKRRKREIETYKLHTSSMGDICKN